MKKFAFLMILVFLAISVFAQNTINYDKILRGDLSDLVGYWIRGNGRFYFQPTNRVYGNVMKRENGIYSWTAGHFGMMLLPVGVPYYFETDTTRVRLAMGQDGPSSPEQFYYKEDEFPATHITDENLRLRTEQDLSSSTIKILEKGTEVLVQKWGNAVTIDGSSARWAYVFTSDGFEGWCYSGYLKELSK
jgi:hypothetical protein